MSTVSVYAAPSATDPLTRTTIVCRDVGPHDVAFDIHFAAQPATPKDRRALEVRALEVPVLVFGVDGFADHVAGARP